MFCRSLFFLLYFFFQPLCWLFFFDIRIRITPLTSSNCPSYFFILMFKFVMVHPWNIWVCWINLVFVTELTVVIFFCSCSRLEYKNSILLGKNTFIIPYFQVFKNICIVFTIISPTNNKLSKKTKETILRKYVGLEK